MASSSSSWSSISSILTSSSTSTAASISSSTSPSSSSISSSFTTPAVASTARAAAAAATTTTTTTTTNQPASSSPASSISSATHNANHHHPHLHNQSPITLYSAPTRSFRPDRLTTLDLIIVVIYLCLLLSTSISTMMRTKRSNKRKAALALSQGQTHKGSGNLMASGRKMSWLTVGASIFASNLGSEHFIGVSGSAAANGISVAAFELNALIILQLATWIFTPVLIVSKISTIPEYMSKRFGGKRIRSYMAVLSLILYILCRISVNLYSGGIFLQQAIGWNLYTSAMFILGLTSVMTLTGGVKGAMVIDNLQAIILTVGASFVSAKALSAIGGLDGLMHKYSLSIPTKVPANLTHCARPNPRAFQLLRPMDDKNMPWLAFLVGQTPASVWFFCADQMMVQRFLSARSLAHAQGSTVFAGYLKILIILFMVLPGMISRCLFTDEVACIDPVDCQNFCQSTVSCSNTAYPRLILELLPAGARGMMVAAMLAAIMGDLCNVFNSATALFTCDIYPLFRKYPSQKELGTSGKVFVIFFVLASIMWIPVIQEMQGGQLFIYIQSIMGLFCPPTCAAFVCAMLWKRTNEAGAFWGLMVGFVLGIIRMVMLFTYSEPNCGEDFDARPWLLKEVHYMYYGCFLFLVTALSIILISLCTKPPAPFRLIRTTYWTRYDTSLRKDDKNVFEMKYSGASTSTGARSSSQDNLQQNKRASDDFTSANSSDTLSASKSSQQRLFTIEEQQEKQTADLSSVIVDINSAQTDPSQTTSKQDNQPANKRTLQQQASLGAAVASEAGKFIASKLANEVNLKGAKDMVKAAASHLTGSGQPSSHIKFKNLKGDEDDEDLRESTTMDEEEEEDDDEDDEGYSKKLRQKRNRRQKSVLSALGSYKMKQKGGYKKASNFDDDDDDDEDEGRKLAGSSSSSGSRKKFKSQRISKYEEELDEESDRTYKCLDNSISLLFKTKLEDTILKIALSAIVFVCFGIFIILSLPTSPPPKQVVDMLIKS